MDFAWIANVGSHFNTAVAHTPWAQVISSPMAGSSCTATGSTNMDAHWHPIPPQYAAYEHQSDASESQAVVNPVTTPAVPVLERHATPSRPHDDASGDRTSCMAPMTHRLGRSLSPPTPAQQFLAPQYPVYSDAPLVAATPTYALPCAPHVPYPSPPPLQMDRPQKPSGNRNLEQFFPELSSPPQQRYHIPRSVPTPQPMALQPGASVLSANDPMDFTPAMSHNPDFQPAISHSTTGMRMLGWIGRAASIGQRTCRPCLKVNTNQVAPPVVSPFHRSPSSASSAASCSRSPRRSKAQVPCGDMHCHHCNASFHTPGDLTHHLRSHQPYFSRNHVCQKCNKRFQYRKDLMRHLPRHDPNRPKFYCPFHGCKYRAKGFGRQDHLDRHINTQHNRVDSPHDARSRNPSNRA